MQATKLKTAAPDEKAGRSSQYLRFQIAGDDYAFDVVKTKEVISAVSITPLPTKVTFLAGVINLRGSIIPVIDLRKKFGLPPAEAGEGGSIIVVEAESQGQSVVVGALVDSVKSVVRFEEDEHEGAPRFGMHIDSRLVRAIAKKPGLFVTVLDTEQLFSERELWFSGQGEAAAPSPS